ncbi:MAG: hypothetical protein ABIR25_00485 [Sphingomicrobium sp.]
MRCLLRFGVSWSCFETKARRFCNTCSSNDSWQEPGAIRTVCCLDHNQPAIHVRGEASRMGTLFDTGLEIGFQLQPIFDDRCTCVAEKPLLLRNDSLKILGIVLG